MLSSSTVVTAGLKRAVPRWSVPDKRSEVYVAGDQVRIFEFSFEHQRSRVASYIAEHEFDRPGKGHGVLVVSAPLGFRRLARSPDFQSWVDDHQGTLACVLRIQAQRTLASVREGDLDVPAADHSCRLRVSHGSEACLND